MPSNLILFFRGFKIGFSEFGHIITGIVNRILLSLVYFLSVGPVSLVARIAGKTFLEMEINPARGSYWEKLDAQKREKKDFYRQF